MNRLVQSAVVQAKLTIGPADDEYEREADRVADEVMRMPAAPPTALRAARIVQRKCHECESAESQATAGGGIKRQCAECEQEEEKESEGELRLQAKRADATTPAVPDGLATYVRSRSGHGRPLDPATRSDMEARFGQDFRRVRLHDDAAAAASARSISARAYTVADNIVFAAGEFAPATSDGRRLLAHELTHVVQQSSAAPTNGRISSRASTAGPLIARQRGGGKAGSPGAVERMSAEDALAAIAEYRGGAGDNSFAALAAIQGALKPPFTTENAARRRLLLRAAFSLLDKETAARVLQVLTKPEGAAQKSLRDRFERLDRSVRRPLLDMLREPAPAPTAEAAPTATPSPRPSAAWLALGEGVYAYLVGRRGMTLDHVARYMTGHPDLPDLLAHVNKLPRNQRLEELHPVVVPIDYIDTNYPAWEDMPPHIRESIANARSARAGQESFRRFATVDTRRTGGVGLFPTTGALFGSAAEALLEASKALLGAIKAVGRLIKGVILAPYYAAKSIYAFFEGLIDGLRGSLDADTFRRIVDKKPSKLDLVVFVPAYSAGVIKGIYDEGKNLVESLADIIGDPLAFLKSLADLIVAFLTPEGGPVFRALGEAMGKQFADRIKELATESLAGFAFAVGKIAGYVLVEIVLTMIGARAGKFALEAAEKLRGIKKFERLLEKLPHKRVDAPDAPRKRLLPNVLSGCKMGSLLCSLDDLQHLPGFVRHLKGRPHLDYVGRLRPDVELTLSPSLRRQITIPGGDAAYIRYLREVPYDEWPERFVEEMRRVERLPASRVGDEFRIIQVRGQPQRWPHDSTRRPWTIHHEPPTDWGGGDTPDFWKPIPQNIHFDIGKWWDDLKRMTVRQFPPGDRRAYISADELTRLGLDFE